MNAMTTMKGWRAGWILIAALFLPVSNLPAMPGAAHDQLAFSLLSGSGSQGGKPIPGKQGIAQVNRYMDAASRTLGSWHGSQLHNPDLVATKLSQSLGLPYKDVRNAARLHKIADVAHNTRAVDGWQISPRMRRQADGIITHVKKHGKMPKRLPAWVDRPGPQIAGTSTSNALAGVKGGAGFGALYFVIVSGIDAVQTVRGATNGNDLPAKTATNGVKAASAGALYGMGLVVMSNPGTATLFILGAGSIAVVEVAHHRLNPYLERTQRAYAAYNSRLPASLRGASPADRLTESGPLKGFRQSYGPRQRNQRLIWQSSATLGK